MAHKWSTDPTVVRTEIVWGIVLVIAVIRFLFLVLS